MGAAERQEGSAHEQALVYARELREMLEEQKKRSQELENVKRSLELTVSRLKTAESTRQEFLTSTSHEFLTPLTTILGWAELLQEGGVDQRELASVAKTIERNGEVLLNLVKSLLKITAIQQQPEGVDFSQADITEVLERAAGAARRSGRRVEVWVAAGAQTAEVCEQDLSEALAHLMDNALKFAPEGPIRLTAQMAADDLVVAVEDAGPGVDPQIRDRVCEPFSQADASSTRLHGGLGIGMYVTKLLVERQGGRLWIESSRLGGTRVNLSIPQVRSTRT